MATSATRFSSEFTALRNPVTSFVEFLGSGGIVSYVSRQNLAILTDFTAVLVLQHAHEYLAPRRLRLISEYVQVRRELPGAQILDLRQSWNPGDARCRSTLADRSSEVLELLALVQAQHGAAVSERHKLSGPGSFRQPTADLSSPAGLMVRIAMDYYRTLLIPACVESYSGILSDVQEPTSSWRFLETERKGVYFRSKTKSYYGLVMPDAETDADRTPDRHPDRGTSRSTPESDH